MWGSQVIMSAINFFATSKVYGSKWNVIENRPFNNEEKAMIESVGTAKVIYTVEKHPEDEGKAVVTYWLENGVKIGQMDVPRGDGRNSQ